MAGYHFRTPSGFKTSKASCDTVLAQLRADGALGRSGPVTVMNGFKAAASADGGCVEVFIEIPGSPSAPTPSPPPGEAVDVGSYQGYYDSQEGGGANLYVELPKAGGDAAHPIFLVLYAQGLTEDQLIAVAQSGLPGSP